MIKVACQYISILPDWFQVISIISWFSLFFYVSYYFLSKIIDNGEEVNPGFLKQMMELQGWKEMQYRKISEPPKIEEKIK